jgi:hypothetical protein
MPTGDLFKWRDEAGRGFDDYMHAAYIGTCGFIRLQRDMWALKRKYLRIP